MLLRAIFAAVLHIATTLSSTYNNLIFTATVFRTLDAATEQGPQLITLVNRMVPLQLASSSRVQSISSNVSNVANVYAAEVSFVADTVSPTSAPAPAPTTVATATDDAFFLPTVLELIPANFSETSLPVLAPFTDAVEVVVCEPKPSSGELLLYDEEYARQQRRAFSIWANIEWDLIVMEIVISIVVSRLCRRYKTEIPTPNTLATTDEVMAPFDALQLAALFPYIANNAPKAPVAPPVHTPSQDTFAADLAEPQPLSNSEARVEPPTLDATAPPPHTTHNAHNTPVPVDVSITGRVEQTQLPIARLEVPSISIVVPTPHTTHPKPTAPVNAVTDQLEPLLASGGVDNPGTHSYDDEALPPVQSESSYTHPYLSELSKPDQSVEKGTPQVETLAYDTLDSDTAFMATIRPTAAPEGLEPLVPAFDNTTTDVAPEVLVSACLEDNADIDHEGASSIVSVEGPPPTNEDSRAEEPNESELPHHDAAPAQGGVEGSPITTDDHDAAGEHAIDQASDDEDDDDVFDYAKARAELDRERALAGDQDVTTMGPLADTLTDIANVVDESEPPPPSAMGDMSAPILPSPLTTIAEASSTPATEARPVSALAPPSSKNDLPVWHPKSYEAMVASRTNLKPKVPNEEQTTDIEVAQLVASVSPPASKDTASAPPLEETSSWDSQHAPKGPAREAFLAMQRNTSDDTQPQHTTARPPAPHAYHGASSNSIPVYVTTPHRPSPPYQPALHWTNNNFRAPGHAAFGVRMGPAGSHLSRSRHGRTRHAPDAFAADTSCYELSRS
ncbi:hypothetical protein PENSPDRAFT_682467 [Peniophora sp. CONT]|nr:hypothetical protein PENSPDRAFT_682467 [Peniophora sp. CONT]